MAREVGKGDGTGFTVNVPLQHGSGDGAVRLVFDSLVAPLARTFRPELILVSAGYDPQQGDPLGGLEFSESAFQWMAAYLVRLSGEVDAAGPVCFLEGGYTPQMVARSIVATIRGLQGETPKFEPAASADERADVREALEEAKPYWPAAL
jgi:acetoin utilization deacetylase AcuC-like enzyme